MKFKVQQYKPSKSQYVLGIAGLLYFLVGIAVIVLYNNDLFKIDGLLYKFMVRYVGVGLVFAIAFLSVKLLVVDIDEKSMYTEYKFLIFKIPFPKKSLPVIDYVCAFCQLQSDRDNKDNVMCSYVYDVNAWYGNKHIKLCSQYTAKEAMLIATKLADGLNCNLLNATDPENKVWVKG